MADQAAIDYVREQYERELKRKGPDAASTRMWKEQLRLVESGAAGKSAEANFFSGHSRPMR